MVPVTSVAFSPDGTQIISGSEPGTIKLRDAKSFEELLTLKNHYYTKFTSVAFNPDGTQIVSLESSGLIKLWDAETGKQLVTL